MGRLLSSLINSTRFGLTYPGRSIRRKMATLNQQPSGPPRRLQRIMKEKSRKIKRSIGNFIWNAFISVPDIEWLNRWLRRVQIRRQIKKWKSWDLVKPLPARRKRALTMPVVHKRQQSFEQTQSRLFKLPVELRLAIYKMAIGGLICHVRCVLAQGKSMLSNYDCAGCLLGRTWWKFERGIHRTAHPGHNLLPLLLTCRKTHVSHLCNSFMTYPSYLTPSQLLRSNRRPLCNQHFLCKRTRFFRQPHPGTSARPSQHHHPPSAFLLDPSPPLRGDPPYFSTT